MIRLDIRIWILRKQYFPLLQKCFFICQNVNLFSPSCVHKNIYEGSQLIYDTFQEL